MIHYMATIYANMVEKGVRTIDGVPGVDPYNNLDVRKSTMAVLIVRKIKSNHITYAQICGAEGAEETDINYYDVVFYGVAKDEAELQALIVEYAAQQNVEL